LGRPVIRLALERRVQELCRRAIREGIVASAHDCSEGGLAVALAECCILGIIGFQSSGAISQLPGRWDVSLFGERQSRIVVSLAPEQRPALERLAADLRVPVLELGITGGSRFRWGQHLDLSVQDLDDAWSHGLERALR
jgi:phosphoribosylformylglycinamidine synthase